MKNESKGVILAVLAAIVSGIAIPANKLFVVSIDPTLFTAIRAVIIGLAFLIISFYLSSSKKTQFKKVSWRYLISIAVIGGAFAFLLYFNGLLLTTASRAAILYHSLPLFTAIFAFVFLKERITGKMAYILIAMLVGMAMIYAAQVNPSQLWSNPSLGDLLITAATILWAIESVIAKRAMELGESNFVVSFARMFFGGLILFGFALLFGKFGLIFALSLTQWINILISTVLLLFYVLFWYWSIKLINVTKAASILLIAPVISIAGGVIAFGEPVPLLQIAGTAIILVGGYLLIGVKSETRKA